MNRSKHTLIRIPALAALWTVLGVSCAGDPATPAGTATLEASTMTEAAPDMGPAAGTAPARPALDLRAPAHLETATFALG